MRCKLLIPPDHRSVTKKKNSPVKVDTIKLMIKFSKQRDNFNLKFFYILLQNAQNLLGVYVMQSSNLKAMIAFPNNIVLRMVTIVLSQ